MVWFIDSSMWPNKEKFVNPFFFFFFLAYFVNPFMFFSGYCVYVETYLFNENICRNSIYCYTHVSAV